MVVEGVEDSLRKRSPEPIGPRSVKSVAVDGIPICN